MATHEELLQKAAEYVKMAQPQLDAYRSRHETFVKGASAAAKALADNRLIQAESVDVFCQKVAEDPSSIWGFVTKLAEKYTKDVTESLPADSLGSGAPAGIKSASTSENDPWVARFFPERTSGNGQITD